MEKMQTMKERIAKIIKKDREEFAMYSQKTNQEEEDNKKNTQRFSN